MDKSNCESVMNFRTKNGKLTRSIVEYVNESFIAGNDEFLISTGKALEKFSSRERNIENFNFSGMFVSTK